MKKAPVGDMSYIAKIHLIMTSSHHEKGSSWRHVIHCKDTLDPIAARVLMKILFAARMARYDLLRAVQGLAARVTKWSPDCDKSLHRLICYIHSTLDYKLKAFVGDKISDCKLWCFADADHAGEYDNKSTTGCFLVLIGPNTYFPLTAFSKKQTSVSVSSTEAEVVAANISLHAAGLPSSGFMGLPPERGGRIKHCGRFAKGKCEDST